MPFVTRATPAAPSPPKRSASYNKLFPEGAAPSKLLTILPWLCVFEAAALVPYDLAEAAHLLFPLQQPPAEFLAAMKIPSVGLMYSLLWLGHAGADAVLAWIWYKALSPGTGSIKSSMLQAAAWNGVWAFVNVPLLVLNGVWCWPFGLAIFLACTIVIGASLHIALKHPRVLERAKRA